MIYGYARLLAEGLSVDAQVRQLTNAGCEMVACETAISANTNRGELGRLQSVLGPGDVLLVTSLDRLAHSTRDLLNTLNLVLGSGAGFRALAEPWADTTAPHGGQLVALLYGISQFERGLIRSRTTGGQNLAKRRGVKMGRKPKLTPNQRHEAIERRAAGENLTDIARSYNVSHSTIPRLTPIAPGAPHPRQPPSGMAAGLDH